MLRLARNLLGLIGALILMMVLVSASFILWRSNPGVNIGFFFAASGVIYTMMILMVLNR